MTPVGPSLASQAVRALSDQVGGSKGRAGPVATDLSVDEWMLVDHVGYEPCGLVAGAAVFHIGLVGVQKGNLEVTKLSGAMLEARESAMQHLLDQVEQLGATGVVGVRLGIEVLEGKGHLARFVAVGTAIRRRRATTGKAELPFLSSLSGQEFALLVQGGYQPLAMVMGICVYHVARQSPAAWAKNELRNAELVGYTSALYEARELAMSRMQAEAIELSADGVVGVEVTELSHVWGSHVIEFCAIGTAIRLAADGHQAIAPRVVVPLDDRRVATDPGAITGSATPETRPTL